MNPNVVRGARTPRTRRFPIGLGLLQAHATPSPPHSGTSSDYIPEEDESSDSGSGSDSPISLRRVTRLSTRFTHNPTRSTRSSTRLAIVTPIITEISSSDSDSAHSTPDAAADVVITCCSAQHTARQSPTASPSRNAAAAILGISSVVALKKPPPADSAPSKPPPADADNRRIRVARVVALVLSKAMRPLHTYHELTDMIFDPSSIGSLLQSYNDNVVGVSLAIGRGIFGNAEKDTFEAVAARYNKSEDANAVKDAVTSVDSVKNTVESGFFRVMDRLGIFPADIPLLALLNSVWEDKRGWAAIGETTVDVILALD